MQCVIYEIHRTQERFSFAAVCVCHQEGQTWELNMHGLIYLVGLIVVIPFILSLFGLR